MDGQILHSLVSPATVAVALPWLAVGVVVAWNRRPETAFVAALTATLVPASDALLHPRLLTGFATAGWVRWVLVPVVACVAGGYAAEAVNPMRRSKRAAQATLASARRRAIAAEIQTEKLGREIEGLAAQAPRPAERRRVERRVRAERRLRAYAVAVNRRNRHRRTVRERRAAGRLPSSLQAQVALLRARIGSVDRELDAIHLSGEPPQRRGVPPAF